MEAYSIQNLSFAYPDAEVCAVDRVSLAVHQGEWITLCGASGCGKTTLLRLLKTALAPEGRASGEVRFFGEALGDLPQSRQAAEIGFVMQDPDAQIVTDKVWHELAFGLESLGLDSDTIRLRCAEMAAFFGISDWYLADTATLSGGQKQLLNLAAVMAMQPRALLLDEPTSQLDPIAASEFLAAVHRVNRELGVTVILSEHRLEEAFPMSDRVAVMEGGRIITCAPPREAAEILRRGHHGMFRALPVPMRVHAAVESTLPCPCTVREGRKWLGDVLHGRQSVHFTPRSVRKPVDKTPCLALKNVYFRYKKSGEDVLQNLNLTLERGTICALMGGNGAGKSTALSVACGLMTPQRGRVEVCGKIGMLPQDPRAMFLRDTLEKDLVDGGHSAEDIAWAAELCRLQGLMTRHPFDLSGGEMQRAALAKVLLTKPDILLLDEPTKGMDAGFKEELGGILAQLAEQGCAILAVSHDVEFCARHADVCHMMFGGEIISRGAPQEFFGGNSFYTTAANRMARGMIHGAVTAEDIISACGGREESAPQKAPPRTAAPPENTIPENPPRTGSSFALCASLISILLAAATIWCGVRFFGDRQYYIISLAVIFELSVPFFLSFEKRRPSAREIVLLAVLCAIGVAGRAAFFWLPQFKPVAALVIISAAALGAQSGFLVGAVTAFASNMFFGQGPWTPWQMFAFGLIGFLGGILFHNRRAAQSRLALSIYGALSVLIIYGGILNPASEIMFLGYITPGMLIASYLRGLPLDAIHAAGTAFFLFIAAKPMLAKLKRVKKKYGVYTKK